jgi:biopolymer transport protein ExbD
MRGSKIKISHRKKARVEIIPLIDVIFFLLATFVLFTLSLNRILDLPVVLPGNNPNPDQTVNKDAVTIQVSSDGSLFWNREPIETQDLGGRLTAYINQTAPADRAIMVGGDDRAHYGVVVQVLDAVRSAGIEKFSVATQTTTTGR